MKNKLIRNLSVALLAAASMSAQGSQKLTVQVPFGFHVGSSTLPSGQYTVDTDVVQGVVLLRSADFKSSVMVLAISVQASARPSQGKLIFNKYGDEYFLSQIWRPGDDLGRELPKSRREREVAANARGGIESILAKR